MAPWANIFHRLRRAMKEGVRLGLVAISVHFVRFARQMPITMGGRYAAGKSLNACTSFYNCAPDLPLFVCTPVCMHQFFLRFACTMVRWWTLRSACANLSVHQAPAMERKAAFCLGNGHVDTQNPQNFLKGAQSARRLRRLRAGLRRPRVQKVKLLLRPRPQGAQKRR